MSWCKLKITLCLIFFLTFAGCGTINLGQLDKSVSNRFSSVAVVETGGRAGQLYSRALRQALYVYGQASPAYDLTSSISISSSSSLSVQGVTSTLKRMTMVANFELKKKDDGNVLLRDEITADSTLGTVSSLFGQDQSESHAHDRLATLLAQRVAQRVQLYFLENSVN